MKMTLKEFFESKEKLVINLKTQEQADVFSREADKLGKKWCSGASYLEGNYWKMFKEYSCYSNVGTRDTLNYFINQKTKILQFEDIDWGNKCPLYEELIKNIHFPVYSFRVIESRKSVSLYKDNELLKRVYCHEEDVFDWRIGLGIALQRTVYKDDEDVNYLSKILKYKNMALFCLNKFCDYDLADLEKKVANRKNEDKLIKF